MSASYADISAISYLTGDISYFRSVVVTGSRSGALRTDQVLTAGKSSATTFFSVLMGLIGSAKLLQALARDKLLPGLQVFGRGTKHGDEPQAAILITYAIAQVALFADLNQIATSISMGYQVGIVPRFLPRFLRMTNLIGRHN